MKRKKYLSVVDRIILDTTIRRHQATLAKKDRNILPSIYKKLKATRCCARCGKKKINPDIHHIIPKRKGGTNDEENLINLCKPCHEKLDMEEFLVDHPTMRATKEINENIWGE